MKKSPEESWFVRPGQIVLGRYKIVRPIGRGSTSEVYEAIDHVLGGCRVAVKLFPSLSSSGVDARREIGREILLLSKMDDPRVVRFFDVVNDWARVGYSMEFVRGVPLTALLGDDAPLPLDQVVFLLTRLCQGVRAIHTAGMAHCDLKPDNVLLTPEGTVKIADFGLARLLRCVGSPLASGALGGTFDYMAPEVARGERPGKASDVYSLGMIGFTLLVGRPLYGDLEVFESLRRRTFENPPDPRTDRPDCPEPFARFVRRAIARDPGQRHRSCEEMLDELGECSADLVLGGPIASLEFGKRVRAVSSTPVVPAVGGKPPSLSDAPPLDIQIGRVMLALTVLIISTAGAAWTLARALE